MPINNYLKSLNEQFKTGNATEHTYRGALQNLINEILPKISVTNEPKRQKCGAPDYILNKDELPIGYIEAKNIGDEDLDGKKANKEQFNRYKESLENIIFTDYLDFHWYQDNELVHKVSIGVVSGNKIIPLKSHFKAFENMLNDFSKFQGQTIKNPKKLAEIMASKARLLANVIESALVNDIESDEHTSLFGQLNAFKEILIHDITPSQFADVYSQTIAYGMFAARIYDDDPLTFTRFKVSKNIPSTNPFLKRFFGYIADYEPDERIVWMIDSLAKFFSVCDLEVILRDFGKATKTEDPIIHFYEDFLAAYDPKLRKSRGVWYTPKPVVSFIVRSVDEILKSEFGLPMGLADNSIIKKEINGSAKEFHKVQILDPATGTATFLVEIIKHIHKTFKGQEGIWSDYVDSHLIPRLNGFELLMASYAMAHLNIDLSLKETGYKSTKNSRYRVFLTNSLESPDEKATPDAFMAQWLSDEARQAEKVKTETPVMVIIGNPPYSGESANKGEWIMKLMEDYKKEPGGQEKLKEQNSKFINDDYVKFLRYGQHFIEKNGTGILAFINPHGFLDNPTFRGMRWNLLKTYDKIFTVDLHGNAKKKETAPDGSVDVNVFDIEQGVSINIFVKTGKKKANELGEVFHYDLYGKRELKYDFLLEHSLRNVLYKSLINIHPNLFFTSKEFVAEKEYIKGFSIPELLPLNSLGLLTKRDDLSVDFDQQNLENKINYFLDETKSVDEVCKRFNLFIKDKDKWDANLTRSNVSKSNIKEQIRNFQYRPFDNRKVFYNSYFVARPNLKVLGHFKNENVGLIVGRQGQAVGGGEWNVIFICKYLTDQNIYRRGGGTIFPLYLYPDTKGQQSMGQSAPASPSDGNETMVREPNLNMKIVEQIAQNLGLRFVSEKTQENLDKNEYKTPQNLPKGETLNPNTSQSPSFGGVGEVGHGEVVETPQNFPKGETLSPNTSQSPSFGGVGDIGHGEVVETPLNLPKGETLNPNTSQSPSFGGVGDIGLGEVVDTPLNLPKGETLSPNTSQSPSFGGVGEVGHGEVVETPLNLPKGETLSPNTSQSPSFGGVGEFGHGEVVETPLNLPKGETLSPNTSQSPSFGGVGEFGHGEVVDTPQNLPKGETLSPNTSQSPSFGGVGEFGHGEVVETPLNLPKGETLSPNTSQSPSFGGVGEVGHGEVVDTPQNLPKGETLSPNTSQSPSFGGVGEFGLGAVVDTPQNLPKGETLSPNTSQSPSFGGVGEFGLGEVVDTPQNLPKGETLSPNTSQSPSFGGVGEFGHGEVVETPLNLPKGETLSPNTSQSPSFGGVGEVGHGKINNSKPGYITANPKHYILIKDMRKSLKDNPTEAEKLIWEYLKTKKTGYKIRRQHVIDNFVTDFVCLSKKVVIEIDGKIHLQQKEYDELRTAKLNELQYEIIRFTNEEVFANPELVAMKIKEKLDSKADLQSDELASTFSEEENFVGTDSMVSESVELAPIDILDYIYAVLHSPMYREKYKEFLKIDFPRVPYPTDKEKFWELVRIGGEIRELHLLESKVFDNMRANFPVSGTNEVTRKMTTNSYGFELTNKEKAIGKVWINEKQYFDDVPLTAWEFYIGGYQPAQKWLKDRHGRTLGYEDVIHYQKIIIALTETARLMKEIDLVGVE